MNSLPRISIVTPSYNQGDFIEETILSVVGQEYSNLEYIIIDGGSTDSTVEIIKKHEKRITFWSSERDKGQSDALNKGFARATGEILAWLNSDDRYFLHTLDTIANSFLKFVEVDLLYGDLELIDEDSRIVGTRRVVPYNYTLALYGLSSIPQPSTFFRRRALQRVGLLDESLHYQMDTDLFLRFGRARLQTKHIPVPLAQFRIHKAGKTVSEYEGQVEVANKVILEKAFGRPISPLELKILGIVRQCARFLIYLQRVVLRGDLRPWQVRSAVRRAVR